MNSRYCVMLSGSMGAVVDDGVANKEPEIRFDFVIGSDCSQTIRKVIRPIHRSSGANL